MATKRKYNLDGDDCLRDFIASSKKYSLESDEDCSDDYENDDLSNLEIEGEEDGVSKVQDEIKVTPFNMREELEEGYFDKEGYYHWHKSNGVGDNWIDNLDRIKIESTSNNSKLHKGSSPTKSASDCNEVSLYKELLSYMSGRENVAEALRRLGKSRINLSSVERLKLRKHGAPDGNGDKITKITELANKILTETGNIDIYQMTYESIKEKINSIPSTSA